MDATTPRPERIIRAKLTATRNEYRVRDEMTLRLLLRTFSPHWPLHSSTGRLARREDPTNA